MKNYQIVARELVVVERAAWWNPRLRRILKAAPLVVMFLLLNTHAARAACSLNPMPDPTVDGSSNSLRHAIQMANASGQDCLIQLQAGTYTLTIANTSGQDNTAAQGDLDITASGHTVTIQGKGAQASIVNGNGIDRVFQVLGGANAVFSKLTIEGGVAQDDGTAGSQPGTTESDGGGFLVEEGGNVVLSQVWVKGNQAIGGKGANGVCGPLGAGGPGEAAAGGGLFLSSGAIDLIDSKLSENVAIGGSGGNALFAATGCPSSGFGGNGGNGGAGGGGGLYVLSGKVAVSKSTVSGNAATGASAGLGICNICHGGGFLPNSNGNGGDGEGAGLFFERGTLSLRQTTVSGNSATGGTARTNAASQSVICNGSGGSSRGAGIFVNSGSINLANITLFANQAEGGSAEYCPPFLSSPPMTGAGGNAAGGGLYISSGVVLLTGDTVASNRALTGFEKVNPGSSSGGGIANAPTTHLITKTTLIGNNTQDSGSTSNGDDVLGTITPSYSLIGQTAGATITDNGGNTFNVNPGLDPIGLRFNGGPTQTVALQQGSPADGTGDNAICQQAAPTGLGGIDQRGFLRFRRGDQLCDIGAFEFVNLLVQPFQPASLSFGSEPVGHQTPYQNASVTNNQVIRVALIKSIGGADPADFIMVGSCGSSLAPHASCTISIAFRPRVVGTRTAQLTATDRPDPTSPYQVTLTGIGK